MTSVPPIPTAGTNVLLPRPLVESLVLAASGRAADGRAAMSELDQAAGLRWVSAGGRDSVVALDELRAAVGRFDGLDAARRTRLDSVLQLTGESPRLTLGKAAARLGLDPGEGVGVRAALQLRGLDVVLDGSTGRRVQRVPEAFIDASSAKALARSVPPAPALQPVVAAADVAPSGARRGVELLAGTAVVAVERFQQLSPRVRAGVIGGVALLGAAGAVGAGLAMRSASKDVGGGSAASTPSVSAETDAPVAPVSGRDRIIQAAMKQISAGAAAASGSTDPAVVAEAEKTRAAIVESAVDLIGTSDLAADGSIDPTVREIKAGVVDGAPDDPAASWEVAFVTHVAKAAGAPIGVDGTGAATAMDLRVWAEESGRFRRADDAAARVPGNLVLLERLDAKGLTYHDVGVVTASADGKGLMIFAGNRMAGQSVEIAGEKIYVGTVGTIDDQPVPLDSTLATNGIRIEGYIDPVSAPLPVAPKPVVVDKKAVELQKRNQIVERARSMAGVTEDESKGPNRGKQVDTFWKSSGNLQLNDNDRLWCAAYTSWVYNEERMPYLDRDGAVSTVQIRKWAVDNDIWNKRSSDYVPQPGDLIGFKSERNTNPLNHIGIVTSYDPATRTVRTIEGNTSSVDQDSNGGGVFEKSYDRDDPYIRGFVNVFEYYDKHPDGPT